MRGFESPISVRNASNNLDDSTVQTLLKVCSKNSNIFQDYFREKAKMLGYRKLQRYDLYAPLSLKSSDQKKFTYSDAVNTVLKTFGGFDPQFRVLSERVFNESACRFRNPKKQAGWSVLFHNISEANTICITKL